MSRSTTFKKAPTMQDKSLLMGRPLLASRSTVPPEIRIKILKMILCQGRLYNGAAPKGGRPEHYNLSSQILRTCQQLYHESKDVLYGQNVLIVETKEDIIRQGLVCRIFGISVALPFTVSAAARYKHGLIDCLQRQVREAQREYNHSLRLQKAILKTARGSSTRVKMMNSFDDGESICVAENDFIKIYPVLDQFKKVHVSLQSSTQADVAVACRMLADLLKGKLVTVEMRDGTPEPQLAACQALRCKQFKFVDVDEVQAAAFTTVITSDQPVEHDTVALWERAQTVVGSAIRQREDDEFYAKHARLRRDFQTAALNCDYDRYKELEQDLVNKALKWSEDWEKRRADEAAQKLKKAGQKVKAKLETLLD